MTAPVHVVGGGFAGAAAATALAGAGLPVVLWEAGPSPGGRARGFAHPESGEVLDNGPHLFAGCYRRTRHLLAALGTGAGLTFQDRLHVPMRVDGADRGLSCPPLPAPAALVLGLMGLGPLSLVERLRLLRAGHALRRPELPTGTVAAWLARARMPPAAVRLLWDPLCRAIMNLPPAEADANLFARALQVALLGTRDDARLGWASGGLGALLGDALEKHLVGRGGEVRRDRVARVTVDAATGRVTGLVAADGAGVAADRVVVAVDAFSARGLLPDDGRLGGLRSALAAMRPAPIVSAYLWLDRRVVAFPPGTPFVGLVPEADAPDAAGAAEWVFDRDRMAGAGAPAGGQRIATVASCAEALADLPADRVVARVRRVLARHYPAMEQARVVRSQVVKERRATVRLTPGLVRPAPGAVPGVPGLFLCGDYTATGLPATVEGAVVSGEAAARAVLAP